MKTILDFSATAYARNETVTVPVLLDAGGESVNGIEGTIMYPAGMMDLKEIQDANSKINFWIEKPHATAPGTVSFSGITPGGLSGGRELLFNLVFHTKDNESTGAIAVNATVFRNDGTGAAVVVPVTRTNISINAALAAASQAKTLADRDNPEAFVPLIGKDENLFEGKAFVAFSTQDKGSGIDHYEVKEGVFGKYITAESPYVLHHQSLKKIIYIKAVDRSGNREVVSIRGNNMHSVYLFWIIIGILFAVIVTGILYKKVWRKNIHSSY